MRFPRSSSALPVLAGSPFVALAALQAAPVPWRKASPPAAETRRAAALLPTSDSTGRPSRVLLRPAAATNLRALATRHGFRWRMLPGPADGWLVAEFPSASARSSRAMPPLPEAMPVTRGWCVGLGIPDDPFFPSAWHLLNTGQQGAVEGFDINVTPVWGDFAGAGTRGGGVRIGIIDDGVESDHPDLPADDLTDRDWSLHLPNDAVPWDGNPKLTTDNHGTAVAGIAAALAHNGLGVAGVAPEARLVGLRLLGGALDGTGVLLDDADVAEAFGYLAQSGAATIHVKNGSWGPVDTAHAFDGPGFLAERALRWATTHGRDGRGTIFVFAAGNGRFFGEDANANGYANAPETIAVGAIRENGDVAPYSEPGSCLLVCAPGGADESLILHPDPASRREGIYTTDRSGVAGYNTNAASLNNGFTRTFTGTSAAAPIVSGVCALLLQTNPGLGWRDVQEILVRSAWKINDTDAGWLTNAAGFHFHDDFGAGLVDAAAATTLAADWTNLPHRKAAETTSPQFLLIPEGAEGAVVPLTLAGTGLRAEHVTLGVQILHPRRGQLRLELNSPSGTASVLKRAATSDSHADIDWIFSTVQLWGEPADGTWTLRIIDTEDGVTGSLVRADLRVYGASPIPDDYETWLAQTFGETVVADASQRHVWGPEADPDHDGWSNLAEAYFGTPPLTPSPVSPWSVSLEGDTPETRAIHLHWTVGALDELEATVQWSPDLAHWYQGDEAPDGQARGLIVQRDGAAHTATLPLTGGNTAWLRLSIGRQPSLLAAP